MAFDEFSADRIRSVFRAKSIFFLEKRMFGGLCFMVDEKMACGVIYNKKKNIDLLMIRIGEEAANNNSKKLGYQPMDFTGRPMKDYAFITPEGYDLEADLEHWIQLCIQFNPMAKKSKK